MAKLTQSTSASSSSFTADDFLNFFMDKIALIRNKTISQQLSNNTMDQGSVIRASCLVIQFEPISSEALSPLAAASKPTTCALDPIPSELFKKLFPLLNSPTPAIFNRTFSQGCVPVAFKTAIIKLLLKKHNSDPLVLDN